MERRESASAAGNGFRFPRIGALQVGREVLRSVDGSVAQRRHAARTCKQGIFYNDAARFLQILAGQAASLIEDSSGAPSTHDPHRC